MHLRNGECIRVEVFDGGGKSRDVFAVPVGSNLWAALRGRGVFLGRSCSGVGMCGSCLVEVDEEYLPALDARSEEELERLRQLGKRDEAGRMYRLACQVSVRGNIRITMSCG